MWFGSVKEDKFLHTSISFKLPTAWIMYIIYLYYTYLGSRKRQRRDGFNWGAKKKRLCIHAGGLQFYPGSKKGSGWHCTWMWAGTAIRGPCNITSSMADKRRYGAINCAENPVFGLLEAQLRHPPGIWNEKEQCEPLKVKLEHKLDQRRETGCHLNNYKASSLQVISCAKHWGLLHTTSHFIFTATLSCFYNQWYKGKWA